MSHRSFGTGFGPLAASPPKPPKPDPCSPRPVEPVTDERRPTLDATPKSGRTDHSSRFTLTFHDEFKDMGKLERMVRGTAFEMAFGALILINTLIMILEVQYEGINSDRIVGYSAEIGAGPTAADVWPGMSAFFVVCEWIFGVGFTVELLLKIAGMGTGFCSAVNFFDLIIVVLWIVDKCTIATGGGGSFAINPMVLRFLRLARLLR